MALLKRAATFLATDASVLAGAGLTSYGAGLIYRPAGFIVGGLLLLGLGLGMARATR